VRQQAHLLAVVAPENAPTLTAGKVEPVVSQPLRTVGNVKVGSGFRFSRDVMAFQLVKEGELIAQVSQGPCWQPECSWLPQTLNPKP